MTLPGRFDLEAGSTVWLSWERKKGVCSPCLLSTGDIGTPVAQCLSVNKNSHQWQQGGSVFYRGWLVWNPLFFVQGIASPDFEACQIRWVYYGTFKSPTLSLSSEPSLSGIQAYDLFCRLLWDFKYILGPIQYCNTQVWGGQWIYRPFP